MVTKMIMAVLTLLAIEIVGITKEQMIAIRLRLIFVKKMNALRGRKVIKATTTKRP